MKTSLWTQWKYSMLTKELSKFYLGIWNRTWTRIKKNEKEALSNCTCDRCGQALASETKELKDLRNYFK